MLDPVAQGGEQLSLHGQCYTPHGDPEPKQLEPWGISEANFIICLRQEEGSLGCAENIPATRGKCGFGTWSITLKFLPELRGLF